MHSIAERVAETQRESRELDFKESFDPDNTPECIELIKDIIAMANSGGGLIVIGVCDDGESSNADVRPLLGFDPAKLADKIHRYTEVHFSDFEIIEAQRNDKLVAALVIGPSLDTPIVFSSPGTYAVHGGKQQKTVFGRGTVYFRHGAKSEPGTTADLREFIDRRFDRLREEWIDRVRQVVLAPEGARIALVEATASDSGGIPTRIRLSNDPDAPIYGRLSPDQTHPYRQKELLKALNDHLPQGGMINSYDLLCIRRIYDISEVVHPEFTYEPAYSSAQYSDQFLGWLLASYHDDSEFFLKARDQYFRSK